MPPTSHQNNHNEAQRAEQPCIGSITNPVFYGLANNKLENATWHKFLEGLCQKMIGFFENIKEWSYDNEQDLTHIKQMAH